MDDAPNCACGVCVASVAAHLRSTASWRAAACGRVGDDDDDDDEDDAEEENDDDDDDDDA